MHYVELAWARDHERLTYITPSIAALVGYSAEEIMAMARPHDVLMHPDHAHTIQALFRGEPNTITAHTLDLVLRHKDGSDAPCQCTMICRYDDHGDLAEMWGSARRVCPHHAQMEVWWERSCHPTRLGVLGVAALYPV